jgi:hypothetical protein
MKGKKHRTMRKKKHTSRKYKRGSKIIQSIKRGTQKTMPRIKIGLENLGQQVRTTTTTSVPYLQSSLRNFLEKIPTKKTRKTYRRK